VQKVGETDKSRRAVGGNKLGRKAEGRRKAYGEVEFGPNGPAEPWKSAIIEKKDGGNGKRREEVRKWKIDERKQQRGRRNKQINKPQRKVQRKSKTGKNPLGKRMQI